MIMRRKNLLVLAVMAVMGNYLPLGGVLVGASAATEYGIYVADKLVDSDNASDILGDGHFKYDNATKTLTVTDATIDNQTGMFGTGISNYLVDGLTIKLVGTSTFSTRLNTISSAKSFTISGKGTLNGTSTTSSCLYLWDNDITCTINGPVLNLTANSYALQGAYGTESVSVKGSTTRLTLTSGTGSAVVRSLKSLSRSSGLYITEPVYGYFDPELKTITTDGTSAYQGTVVISSTPASYGLLIGETEVTARNAGDILDDGGVFSFSSKTRTLVVNNATLANLDGKYGHGIYNLSVDGLTVRLEGTSSFNVRNNPVFSMRPLTITGTGTLTATSSENSGIMLVGGCESLTIDGPTLDITGRQYGLYDYEKTATLYMKSGGLTLRSEEPETYPAIYNLKLLDLATDYFILDPADGFFSPASGSVTIDGTTVYKGAVTLGRSYGLYVNETPVSVVNADDILGDGTFSFDASTNTLTVTDATIDNQDGVIGCGIDNRRVDGLTVRLVGTSTFNTRNEPICSEKSLTVGGTGTLTGISSEAAGIMLTGDCETLTIDGATLDITGHMSGLWDYEKEATLCMKRGSLTLRSEAPDTYPAIYNLKGLDLGYNCLILDPEDGQFAPELGTVTTDGTTAYKGTVTLLHGEYSLWIGETRVTAANADDILGDGTFRFDRHTKTLTVTDATLDNMDGFSGFGINNFEFDGLTVNLVGASTFNTRSHVIYSDKSLTISGTGTLAGTSTNDSGIQLGYSCESLTVDGPSIDILGHVYGLKDINKSATLCMKSGSLTLRSEAPDTYPAIYNLKGLDLATDCLILDPEEGKFDPSLGSVTTDGTTVYKGTVTMLLFDYGLWIGETLVRPSNADDILGGGTFRFDSETKSLHVRNATLDNLDGPLGTGIYNRDVDGLTVYIWYTNTFNTRSHVIRSDKPLTIDGSGTLTATSSDGAGIMLSGGCESLTIGQQAPDIDITSGTYGLYDEDKSATLYIKGGSLTLRTADPDTYPAICNLKGMDLLSYCFILDPEDGKFDPELGSVTTDGTTAYKGEVTLGDGRYGITIGETPVTVANADDIFGDGTFSFDPETNTLTVTDATLENMDGVWGRGIINNGVDGLTVRLVGTSTFSTRNQVIESDWALTISGTGTLIGTSSEAEGILLNTNCVSLTIDGPTIDITGHYYGLYDQGKTSTLRMKSGSFTLEPDIYNLNGLDLAPDYFILEPEDGYFDPELGSVTTDGTNSYRGTIVIGFSKQGDVNGDSMVDVADIASVIDCMAGSTEVDGKKADVNGDKNVDVADISSIIDIMAAAARRMR